MRRALAILKYVPAVLCGLLVTAWVVSQFFLVGLTLNARTGGSALVELGSVVFLDYPIGNSGLVGTYRGDGHVGYLTCLGIMDKHRFGPARTGFKFPMLFCLTALLPLAVAPFTRFRFPLWSYFAWIALIAAELAYYLR